MRYRLGLIGRQIDYSLSPRIHRWALAQCGLAGDYSLFDLTADAVSALIAQREWDGLNVTVPYKTAAGGFCDHLTPQAARSGAVNTLFWRDGAIWGDLTDVAGCAIALRQLLGDKKIERPLIIGGGGAARAAALALCDDFGCTQLALAVRDPAAAQAHLHSLNLTAELCIATLEHSARRLAEFDLVVQATPVGGSHLPGLPLPGDLAFQRDAAVLDLVYAPRRTAFLERAAASGARLQNGLPMLIAQAAGAFELWTRQPFPLKRAMNEILPQLQTE